LTIGIQSVSQHTTSTNDYKNKIFGYITILEEQYYNPSAINVYKQKSPLLGGANCLPN